MPLNDGAISQILPFCTAGTEAAGDLMSIADYTASTARLRGHQQGMARRELQNRAMRQISLIAAGLAQYIANRYAAGVVDNGDLDAIEAGIAAAIATQTPDASTTVKGLVELATTTETKAGTDTARAVTPKGLADTLAEAIPDDALRASVSKFVSAGFYSWPVTLDIDPDTGATIAYYSIRNVYKLAVTRAVTISNPDAGNHPPGGMAVIVATNDATGHPLVFDTQYRIAAGEWDDSANAVNLMFLVFSPDGVIDVYITQRGEAA